MSLTMENVRRRSISLFVVGFVLLIVLLCVENGNAVETNEKLDDKDAQLVTKMKTSVTGIIQSFSDRTTTESNLSSSSTSSSSTTTNETSNLTETTTVMNFWKEPFGIRHVKRIFSEVTRVLAQLLIIFGGILPYIPQYSVIKRTQNAEGFSNYVCLTLLVANILRIEFWFGKHFEIPLLIQSIVMILCMLIMLELWTRVHAKTLLRRRIPTDIECISASKEQLTEEAIHMRFIDFKIDYFWRWTRFSSYLQFLFLLTILLSIITWIFSGHSVYVESLGLAAVLCEALLGIPQFLRNFRLKSTEGMSVKMVLLWAAGDIFKTVYFILRKAPLQFLICGVLQITIDVAILVQVLLYSNKRGFRQPTT